MLVTCKPAGRNARTFIIKASSGHRHENIIGNGFVVECAEAVSRPFFTVSSCLKLV